jgi:hypothetical protein
VVNAAQTLNTTISFIADTSSAAMSITPTVLTAPASAGAFLVTGAKTADTTNAQTAYATGLTVTANATGRVTAAVTLSFTPDKVGTYTLKLASAGGTNNQSITWTVVATDVAGVSATSSTVAMNTTDCTTADLIWNYGACFSGFGSGIYALANDTATESATLSNARYKTSGSLIASFLLDQKNGAVNTMASTVPWTVAITSGPGNIQMGGRNATAKSVTESIATTGVDGYQAASTTKSAYFVSDGTSGKTVITFTAGTVLVATRTITVYGDVASVTVTGMAKSVLDTVDGTAATDTDAFVGVVTAKDVNGATVPVAAGDFTVSSSTERTAQSVTGAAAVSGVAAATYNGVAITATSVVLVVDPTATKTGAKTLALTHTASKVATTFGFTVALAASTTVAVTNDQASPLPGQKITYTVTAKDAGGNGIPDAASVAVTVIE